MLPLPFALRFAIKITSFQARHHTTGRLRSPDNYLTKSYIFSGAPRKALYSLISWQSGAPISERRPKQVHLMEVLGNPAIPCATGIAGRCDP
jgi:hypothetical protein